MAAVDVVGRAGDGRVDHEVNGERGDVRRSHHPPDRQLRSQLGAARLETVAEQPADRGVSTKPGAIKLTRIGARSSARLAVSAGIAAVTADTIS